MPELEIQIPGRRADVRGSGVDLSERELWTIYETCKADIPTGLPPARYERECEKIAQDLGI